MTPTTEWSGLALNLCQGVQERNAGVDFNLRYHLDDGLRAEALLPCGPKDVFEELEEI